MMEFASIFITSALNSSKIFILVKYPILRHKQEPKFQALPHLRKKETVSHFKTQTKP